MVGGYEYHNGFKPKGCNILINTTAVTAGAGSFVRDIYYNLDQMNQTAVDGLGPEVTLGGYLTGGGHSPISNIYGLGVDQVYEVEMVTPTGEIITANECQNTDLFWAIRGVSTKSPSNIFRNLSHVSGRREYVWRLDEGDYSNGASDPYRGI
jgi:hypothetical protein